MGLFSSNRNVLGGPIKQPPINNDGDYYRWDVLVTKALDAVHGRNVFDGMSKRGPVKVIITSLVGFEQFIDEHNFVNSGIKSAPKAPLGYTDAHISVLRGLLANKLKDPYVIEFIEKNSLDGFQIIYDSGNPGEFNEGLDDLIHSVSVNVNNVVADYEKIAKRLAARHETDMIEVANEFNLWVRLSKEFQETLGAYKN